MFDDAARLLITLLYQRQVCSMRVLGDLLEVTATCIGDTIKQTRPALEDHGHTISAAGSASPPPTLCSRSWTPISALLEPGSSSSCRTRP
jgi:hypothetical protein